MNGWWFGGDLEKNQWRSGQVGERMGGDLDKSKALANEREAIREHA